MRDVLLQRGVRADEAAPGSGLGLAIVADLAEAYGLKLAFGKSSLGGLSVTLTLPFTPMTVSTAPLAPVQLGPTAGLAFEGLGDSTLGFTVRGAPPDTNGAVGLTQYVQWVNESFAVFDKATGALLYGPADGNTLWNGFGGGSSSSERAVALARA